MADTKISALAAAAALDGTEVAPVVQSAATVKATIAQIRDYLSGNATFVEAMQDLAGAMAAAGTGISYNDGAASLSVVDEVIQDLVGAMAAAGTGITYDDAAASLSGVRVHPGGIAANWYLPMMGVLAAGGAYGTANLARFFPFVAPFTGTISTLGVRISTVGSTNLQLAIYANQQKAGEGSRPSTELGKTGNIVNTGTGSVNGALGANVQVTAGQLYWLGINCGDTTMVCTAFSTTFDMIAWLAGSTSQSAVLSAVSTIVQLTTPLALGTWGDLTSATWTESSGSAGLAAIQVKYVSIP